jgi:hypothetical protein
MAQHDRMAHEMRRCAAATPLRSSGARRSGCVMLELVNTMQAFW